MLVSFRGLSSLACDVFKSVSYDPDDLSAALMVVDDRLRRPELARLTWLARLQNTIRGSGTVESIYACYSAGEFQSSNSISSSEAGFEEITITARKPSVK